MFTQDGQFLNNNPWTGFSGVTMRLPNVSFTLGTGDWLNLCVQVNFIDATITYIANGMIRYKGPHSGLKPTENKKTILMVTLMRKVNARIAEVVLLTNKVSESQMIGFTTCQEFPENSLITFGPGLWGLKGTNRTADTEDTLFLPKDFCSKKKLIFFPPQGLPSSAESCKRFGI